MQATQSSYFKLHTHTHTHTHRYIIYIYIYIYLKTPLQEQDVKQGQFFNLSWNSVFSFCKIGWHIEVKEPSLPYYLPIFGKRILGYILLQKLLVLCEMQTSRLGFELGSPCPFFTTITITPRALTPSTNVSVSLSLSIYLSIYICIYKGEVDDLVRIKKCVCNNNECWSNKH